MATAWGRQLGVHAVVHAAAPGLHHHGPQTAVDVPGAQEVVVGGAQVVGPPPRVRARRQCQAGGGLHGRHCSRGAARRGRSAQPRPSTRDRRAQEAFGAFTLSSARQVAVLTLPLSSSSCLVWNFLTAALVAEVFGMDYTQFAAQTSANFDRLFAKAAA